MGDVKNVLIHVDTDMLTHYYWCLGGKTTPKDQSSIFLLPTPNLLSLFFYRGGSGWRNYCGESIHRNLHVTLITTNGIINHESLKRPCKKNKEMSSIIGHFHRQMYTEVKLQYIHTTNSQKL